MSTFPWFILVSVMTLHLQLILCTEYQNGEVNSPFTFVRQDQTLSHNSLVRLRLQGDGNFLLHTRASTSSSDWVTAGWRTATNPNGDHADLQSDGNLVVFSTTGDIQWTSNSITGGTPPFRLIVTDEAAVYILDSANTIVWSTNPSFASLQTVWIEPFNSKDAGWEFSNASLVSLPSTSDSCPNAPPCVRVRHKSWVTIMTAISMYRAIQLQVDIAGLSLETGDDDACEIWWRLDNEWHKYDTRYSDGVYRDVIIDIPLSDSFAPSIDIDLEVSGDDTSDRCFFDNAILRGVLTQMPSYAPTMPPSRDPTATTKDPTANPSVSPTRNPSLSPTDHPSTHPTDITITPTHPPFTSPTKQPSIHPTSAPTKTPSDPVLRADIPTRSDPSKSVSTIYVTHNPTEDVKGNAIAENTLSVMMILLISFSILVVCIVVAILCLLYKLKRNKAVVPSQMESVISQTTDIHKIEAPMVMNPGAVGLQAPSQDVLELCDGEKQTDVARDSVEMLTIEGNEGANQLPNTVADELMTPTGGEAILAPDEFVVIGEDGNEDEDRDEETQWKEETKGYICD